ncbi:hypothetical protein CSKR_100362 [Clonorchis sinensis]|uniref:Uncharacterized protein n=1 Tax=Clonorchis sinensis TaxID=79923 RepID=A0A3R7FK64_CLOSI|nr:hypothetical protein CSKR_100362 [Clonorchis sinensis]
MTVNLAKAEYVEDAMLYSATICGPQNDKTAKLARTWRINDQSETTTCGLPQVVLQIKPQRLRNELTGPTVCRSNTTSTTRLLLSRIGQPGNTVDEFDDIAQDDDEFHGFKVACEGNYDIVDDGLTTVSIPACCLEIAHQLTDRKIRCSNPTSASRLHLSKLGQLADIPYIILVFSSVGIEARHRKGGTTEGLSIIIL